MNEQLTDIKTVDNDGKDINTVDIKVASIYKIGKFRRFYIGFEFTANCESGTFFSIKYTNQNTLNVNAVDYCSDDTLAIGTFTPSSLNFRPYKLNSNGPIWNSSNFILCALTMITTE